MGKFTTSLTVSRPRGAEELLSHLVRLLSRIYFQILSQCFYLFLVCFSLNSMHNESFYCFPWVSHTSFCQEKRKSGVLGLRSGLLLIPPSGNPCGQLPVPCPSSSCRCVAELEGSCEPIRGQGVQWLLCSSGALVPWRIPACTQHLALLQPPTERLFARPEVMPLLETIFAFIPRCRLIPVFV